MQERRSRLSAMGGDYPRLAERLPTLARALRESLLRKGETELAAQVDEATIHGVCGCDEEGCLGVYLAPEREPCVEHYRTVLPDAVVSIGVCRERLDWIDDNELVSPAGADPERRREYEALRPHVPQRLP